jgi:PAT family beta-lactamase induction signal transducer AmpG
MNLTSSIYQKLSKPVIWTFTTYFAEGFPYTIIRTISAIFFRDQGMSLEGLGATSIFGLPWVLKFLWGPLVDTFSTKRKWLLSSEAILCGLFLLAALLIPLNHSINLIASLFFIGSFIAATHDIAIDGFYMEILNHKEQAKYVGYRVMAYRIAMMTGTGVVATIGALYGWQKAFLSADAALIAVFILHYFILPRCESPKEAIFGHLKIFVKSNAIKIFIIAGLIVAIRFLQQSSLWNDLQIRLPLLKKITFPALIGLLLFSALVIVWLSRKRLHNIIKRNPENFYAKSFLSFMDRPGIGIILSFIIMIRAGEYMLSTMYAPFMVDLGLKVHYGWISAGIGLPCSIVGALIGGWLISRQGLKKMIWPFLFLQNITNLLYMFLALNLTDILAINTANPTPVSLSFFQMLSVVAMQAFDQFSGGLGTAVLMTFLMRICRTEFKAAHYAIGTGLMSISGLYAGVISGFITSWVGYGWFFGISFLVSIPGMILAWFVPLEKVSAP